MSSSWPNCFAASVDVIRYDTFQNGAFKDPVQAALIGIKVVPGHGVGFNVGLGALVVRPLRSGRFCLAVDGVGRTGCSVAVLTEESSRSLNTSLGG